MEGSQRAPLSARTLFDVDQLIKKTLKAVKTIIMVLRGLVPYHHNVYSLYCRGCAWPQ